LVKSTDAAQNAWTPLAPDREDPFVTHPSPAASLVALLLSVPALAQPGGTGDLATRARELHRKAIVIDTHIDTTGLLLDADWSFFERHEPAARGARRGTGRPSGNAVDYPRMREGGLDGAFFSIFVPGTLTGAPAVQRALEQIDAVRLLAERHADEIAIARPPLRCAPRTRLARSLRSWVSRAAT
jgi:membrane dipeptidase